MKFDQIIVHFDERDFQRNGSIVRSSNINILARFMRYLQGKPRQHNVRQCLHQNSVTLSDY